MAIHLFIYSSDVREAMKSTLIFSPKHRSDGNAILASFGPLSRQLSINAHHSVNDVLNVNEVWRTHQSERRSSILWHNLGWAAWSRDPVPKLERPWISSNAVCWPFASCITKYCAAYSATSTSTPGTLGRVAVWVDDVVGTLSTFGDVRTFACGRRPANLICYRITLEL